MNRFERDIPREAGRPARGEFDELAVHVRASLLFRVAEAIAMACFDSVDRSAAARRLRTASSRFASTAPGTRLRAAAIAVAAATNGHVALLAFVPPQVAPAMPRTLWVIVGAAALIVAVFADRLIASWDTSATRRLWRMMIGFAS